MKQIYTALAALAALTVSANASLPLVHKTADRSAFTITPPSEARTGSVIRLGDLKSRIGATQGASSRSTAKSAPRKAPEGAWTSIGTGTYCEDLMTIFSGVPEGLKWEVDIEQSATEPGWYRLLPYGDPTCPIAQMLEAPDPEGYLYINASDPQKVYAENLYAYSGSFIFSNAVTEMDWDASMYGTLSDNVISFPAESFCYYNPSNDSWYTACRNTGMTIYLPGAEVKDYAFRMSSPFCADDNTVPVDLICGMDVKEVKLTCLDGEYTCTENNAALVAQYGQSFPGNMTVGIELEEHGMFTLLAVALDADGKIVGKGERRIFGVLDNDDEWTTVGTAALSEGIYSASYEDIYYTTETVTVQRHNTKGDYFRLIDPYATNPWLSDEEKFTHQSHKHCFYIDATRHDFVVLEGGPVGVSIYGEGAVYSVAARYAGTESEDQAKEAGLGGTYDTATRTITIPDDTVYLGETEYDNGRFILGNAGTKIVFDSSIEAGIDHISGDSAAPAEYFNLQGRRIASPSEGLFIRRQGGKVSKTFIN